MEHGQRDFTLRTARASRLWLAVAILVWLVLAVLTVANWKTAWIDPIPLGSERTPGQGRLFAVFSVAWLAWGVWFIAVTSGRIPFLWIRHAADGSITIRTALGKLGFRHKVMRAPSSELVTFRSGGGKKPNWFTPRVWTLQFSGGDRALYAIMLASIDAQELGAKVDGTYQPSGRAT